MKHKGNQKPREDQGSPDPKRDTKRYNNRPQNAHDTNPRCVNPRLLHPSPVNKAKPTEQATNRASNAITELQTHNRHNNR